MTYVLVSGTFETIDTPHKGEYLGQQLEIPEDLAKSIILNGAKLLPKDAFDAQQFNADELKKYPNAILQANAPAAFHSKLASAIAACDVYRAQLAAPPAATTKSTSSEVKK